jgi:hypothetical protein
VQSTSCISASKRVPMSSTIHSPSSLRKHTVERNQTSTVSPLVFRPLSRFTL